jgi:hypothetical protein
MSIEAMKQALEALEEAHSKGHGTYEVIDALRAAIEAQEQCEPVAWKYQVGSKVYLETHRFDHSHWYNGSYVKGTPVYGYPAQPPEGWQLVPVEPTEAMYMSLLDVKEVEDAREDMRNLWTAMLAAAPKGEMK